jgi:hypothetical protein
MMIPPTLRLHRQAASLRMAAGAGAALRLVSATK